MNRKQKRVLAAGLAALLLVLLLSPWLNTLYSLSLPNVEPLLSWGIMDVKVSFNPFFPTLVSVIIVTVILMLFSRSSTQPAAPAPIAAVESET